MARKDEAKKLRRKHRLEKKQKRQQARTVIDRIQSTLDQYAALGDPASFPGTCDETLARPDLIKADLMSFAVNQYPGNAKFERLESGLCDGLLHHLPDIDHWAMEEFTWHGLPGDSWVPVDEYLRLPGLSFSPAARAQIGLWKQARIGVFEIGAIEGDTVWLREWDVVHDKAIGPPLRAITLNLGGVHVHAGNRGLLLVTHLSPWDPDRNIWCGLGYGMAVPRTAALVLHELLGLRQLAVVARPLPWLAGREAEKKWLREWRQREWYGWFAERVQFPFEALVPAAPAGVPALATIRGLVPSTPAEVEQMGIYFHADLGARTAMVAGGTAVTPLDVASPNRQAFAEYHAYRDIAGPPPATRGRPTFMEIGPRGR